MLNYKATNEVNPPSPVTRLVGVVTGGGQWVVDLLD